MELRLPCTLASFYAWAGGLESWRIEESLPAGELVMPRPYAQWLPSLSL